MILADVTWYAQVGSRFFAWSGRGKLTRRAENREHVFLMPATAKLYYSDWVEAKK